jgi:peptidoglycan/LPS O-acetylase OafA/YrhL
LVAYLLMVGNWYIALDFFLSPASLLWSVSVEEQFYVLWAPAMRFLSQRTLIIVAFALLSIAALGRLYLSINSFGFSSIWFMTVTHLDPLAMGILLSFALGCRVPTFPVSVRCALAFLGCGLLLLQTPVVHLLDADRSAIERALVFWLSTTGVTLIFLAFLGANIRLRPILYLGKISYGLYVFHLFTLEVAKAGLLVEFGECLWWQRGAIALPLAVAMAAVSYRWLETPFLRLKERLAQPRTARISFRQVSA